MTWLLLSGALVLVGTGILGQIGRLGVDRPLFLLGYGLASLGYLIGLAGVRRARRVQVPFRGRYVLVVSLVAVSARALILPVPASDDVHRYLWEGRFQSLGGNPYEVSPADAEAYLRDESEGAAPGTGRTPIGLTDPHRSRVNHPELTTLYPPLSQLVFRAASRLSYELLAWKLLMTASELFLVLILAYHLRLLGRPVWGLLAYVWHPLPIVCFAGEGHLDVLLLLAMWGTFALLARRRSGPAGAVWGAAIAIKLLPVIFLPLLVGALGRRGLCAAAAVLVVTALPFVAAGEGLVRVLVLFGREMSHNSPLHLILSGFLPSGVLQDLVASAFLAGAVAIVLRHLRRSERDLVCGSFGLTALVLVLSPTVHPWYLTWLVPYFVLRRPLAWVLLSLTAGLAFLAYGIETETGRFELPRRWMVAEYLPFYLLLLLAAVRRKLPSGPGSPERKCGSQA